MPMLADIHANIIDVPAGEPPLASSHHWCNDSVNHDRHFLPETDEMLVLSHGLSASQLANLVSQDRQRLGECKGGLHIYKRPQRAWSIACTLAPRAKSTMNPITIPVSSLERSFQTQSIGMYSWWMAFNSFVSSLASSSLRSGAAPMAICVWAW
jgi:hypothetical protein